MNEGNNIRKVTKSALLVSIASVITVAISFFKESVLAYCFGTSSDADAFAFSAELPITLLSFLSMAITIAMVPIYSKHKEKKGKKDADKFLNGFITFIIIFSVCFALIFEIFAPLLIDLIAPGLEQYTNSLAVNILRIVLLTACFNLLIKVNTCIANINDSFFLATLHPNIYSFCVIVFSVALYKYIGIYAAVTGLMIGKIVEYIYTIFVRKKYYTFKISLNFKSEGMKEAYRLFLPVFVGIGVDEINKLVDQYFMSSFPSGSVASLHYASKLSSGLSTLFVAAVATAIYPELSKKEANNELSETSRLYEFTIQLYNIILIPIIVGGVFIGKELVSIIYEHGAFDVESVDSTSPLFVFYLSGLLFSAVINISYSMFYIKGTSKIPMINSIILVSLNILLDIVLVKTIGPIGLPLATTIATGVICIKVLIDVKKYNRLVSYIHNITSLLKIIIASIIMLLTLVGVKYVLLDCPYLFESFPRLLYIIVATVVGFIVYSSCLYILKVKEIAYVLQFIKKKLNFSR